MPCKKKSFGEIQWQKEHNAFEKVMVIFDEVFLKKIPGTTCITVPPHYSNNAFLLLKKNELVPNFISSLMHYYSGAGKIDKTFADVKREKLLLILLQANPELATLFPD